MIVFFVDLGGNFGYSVLVFKNGRHIYFANDYELHHGHLVREKGYDELKKYYIKFLNRKLYTDAELLEPIKTYDEYDKKNYFLQNYWIMRYDYLSIFGIGKELEEIEKKKKNYPFYNPVSFCYVKDEKIVDESVKLLNHLESEFEKLKSDDEAFREMISYELANHEACITCDYEPTLDSLGLKFEDLTTSQKQIVKQELKKQIDRYC